MTKANDGIFFMALGDMHKGFFQFDQFLYRDDWKVDNKEFTDDYASDMYSYTIDNPVDQDFLIGMNLVNKRKYMQTDDCSQKFYDFYYIIEVYDSDYNSLGYAYVTSDLGSGDIKLENLSTGQYTVEIYRYNNPTEPENILLTTWANTEAVKIN